MHHPYFSTQADYDRHHKNMTEMREDFFDGKLTVDEISSKLQESFYHFSFCGAIHTINLWKGQKVIIDQLKKDYKNRRVGKAHVVDKLLRLVEYDKNKSEKLIEAWKNEPKEKAR